MYLYFSSLFGFSKFVCINELNLKHLTHLTEISEYQGSKKIPVKMLLIIKLTICVTTPFDFQNKKGMYNQSYMILELP